MRIGMRMTRTVIPTATETEAGTGSSASWTSSLPIHGAAALWIGSMLLLSAQNPPLYDALLQEDRFVEWLTAAFFCAAGVLRVVDGVQRKRWFDLLVGVFCIFVGGEEFSWGQRLVGF